MRNQFMKFGVVAVTWTMCAASSMAQPDPNNPPKGENTTAKDGARKADDARLAAAGLDLEVAHFEALAAKPLTEEQRQKLATAVSSLRAAQQKAQQTAGQTMRDKVAAILGVPPTELETKARAAQAKLKEPVGDRPKPGDLSLFEALAGKPLTDNQKQQLQQVMIVNGPGGKQAVQAATAPMRGQVAAILGLTADELDAKERTAQMQMKLQVASQSELTRWEALNGKPLTAEQRQKLAASIDRRNAAMLAFQAAQDTFRAEAAATLGLPPADLEARVQEMTARDKAGDKAERPGAATPAK